MARSQYIYLIQHIPNGQVNVVTVALFTVKHEAISWAKRNLKSYTSYTLARRKDAGNFCVNRDEAREATYVPWGDE